MKVSPRLWPVLLAAALLPGCGENSRDQTNPFASLAVTVAPPASAALMFTSSLYSLTAGSGREIYAADADGGRVTRLTFCNQQSICDYAEAAPAPDRNRVGARRVSVDTNGDGRIDEADGAALLFVDLSRGVEAGLVPASRRVSGVDWAPNTGDFFIYSALPGGGGNEDLFLINYNGTEDRDLSCPLNATVPCDPTIRDRRPRLDGLESQAVYQRVDAAGASTIARFVNSASQVALTSGPNDADPVFSPDNRRVAFRRLTSASANDGQGNWDILTVAADGSGLQTVQSGPAFRGGPDWGPNGLVGVEADESGKRLVVSAADGSAPRTILTVQPSVSLSNPRWLNAP